VKFALWLSKLDFLTPVDVNIFSILSNGVYWLYKA